MAVEWKSRSTNSMSETILSLNGRHGDHNLEELQHIQESAESPVLLPPVQLRTILEKTVQHQLGLFVDSDVVQVGHGFLAQDPRSEDMVALGFIFCILGRQIRNIRGRMDVMLNLEINITDPIVPRVVRHASWLLHLNRFRFDGENPYRASRGRPNGGKIVELGEQVCWQAPGLALLRFENGWRPAARLGMAEESDSRCGMKPTTTSATQAVEGSPWGEGSEHNSIWWNHRFPRRW